MYNPLNKLIKVYLGDYDIMVIVMIFKIISCIVIGGMIYFLIGLISQNKKTLEMFERLLGK
jgi:antibiotic biosynthesis monooxygenase (ABM) superfamily enzyme